LVQNQRKPAEREEGLLAAGRNRAGLDELAVAIADGRMMEAPRIVPLVDIESAWADADRPENALLSFPD
jgi:hypothetical protein